MTRHTREAGAVGTWTIVGIVFIITTLIAAGVMVWALINYFDQKTNVDGRVDAAVAEAKKAQADELEAEFLEREKDPNRLFAGPEDYGSLSFDYPKTWSVYVDADATSGTSYEAYLNPGVVPPVSDTQQFALRVLIESKDFDRVLNTYSRRVEDGELKSSSIRVNGETATRLEGNFSDDIRGAAVIFKIRDKTVTLRTDANTFLKDYNKLVGTVTFNK